MRIFLYIWTATVLGTVASADSGIRPDECFDPGQRLERTESQISSDNISVGLSFSDSASPNKTYTKSGTVSISTYQNYNEVHCENTAYTRTVRKCKKISDEDLNSGYGNELFMTIARGRRDMEPRVRAVLRNLEFSKATSPEQTHADATVLVKALDIASDGGLEKIGWARLKQKVNGLVGKGVLTQALYSDVFVDRENARHNQAILGFVVKFPNAETSEGTGNDDYFDIFNDNIRLEGRANIVRSVFFEINLDRRQSQGLAQRMMAYSERYSIPETWDDVTYMLRHIEDNSDALSHRDLVAITSTFEKDSREALGFDISGQTCRSHSVNDYYNQRVHRTSKDRITTKSVSYDFKVKGINLIKGESETVHVSLSALARPSVQQGRFHQYKLTSAGIKNGHANLSVQAARQKKAVRNSLTVVEYGRPGNIMNILIKDLDYDPSIGGETFVHISPIEDKLIGDNIHHKKTILKLGAIKGLGKDVVYASIAVPMKKDSRKLSFKYRIERRGSVFFRDEVSSSKQSDRLR